MATAPNFPPLLIRTRYAPDGSAKAAFAAEVSQMTGDAKREFRAAFADVDRAILGTAATMKGARSAFSFDLPGLRQTAADADFALQRLVAMRDGAIKLARSTGDTSSATKSYTDALRAQVIEAAQAKRAADAQVGTYTRLQAEIDQTIASHGRLAQSFRETFAEQARAENTAFRSQRNVNDLAAPAINRRAVDNGAGFGALDQLVRDQEEAQRAMARYSAEAINLRQALDPTIAIQRRFDDEMERADRLLRAGAISTREYASAQALARTNLASSWAALTGTQEQALAATARGLTSVRMASIGAGQQLQDIAISLYGGQRASVVFAQQIPQLAFALSSLEGSSNKTLAALGRFGVIGSGPWGLGIAAAAAGVGYLVSEVIGLGKETEKAERRSRSFVDVMRDSKSAWTEVAKAAREYADAQEQGRQVTLQTIQAEAAATAERLKAAISIREKLAADLEAYEAITRRGAQSVSGDVARSGAFNRADAIRGKITENEARLRSLTAAAGEVVIKTADAIAAIRSDPLERLKTGFDVLRDSARDTIKDTEKLTARLTELNNQQRAAEKAYRATERTGRSERSGTRDTASFITPIAGARVTGQFGEQRPTHRHAGLDLAAPTGTAIRAPQVGTVEAVGFSPTLGKYVVIDHGGGTKTRFGHMSDNSVVQRGDAVSQGDVIGKVGSTGRSTGPHLHYEVTVNGRAVDPSSGKFPIDPIKVAENAQKAQDRLQQFGASAAESIARITEQFDEQPRAIDRVNAATRELEAIMGGLEARDLLTPDTIAQIDAAKAAMADFFERPFREMERDAGRNIAIQNLLSQGREAEAEAARRIWQYEDAMRPLTADRKQRILEIVQAEEAHGRALERSRAMQEAYLGASRSIREEITGVFEGRSADFGSIFKRLNAQVLTEQLFGSMFQDLDRWVQSNTGLGRANDLFIGETGRAGDAMGTFAERALEAANVLAGVSGAGSRAIGGASAAANDNRVVATLIAPGELERAFDAALGRVDADGTIVVAGGVGRGADPSAPLKLPRDTVAGMSPEIYFRQISGNLGNVLGAQLSGVLGPQISDAISSIAGGAFYGNAIGGAPGAILGGVQGLAGAAGLRGAPYKALGDALGGMGEGLMVAGIGNAMGLKMSNTGAAIGGALFGPVGGLAGGLIGKLFSSPKWATSVATGGSASTRGNKGDWEGATGGAASGVNDAIKRLAEQFDATVGNYAVSLGLNNGNWHVSTTGRSGRLRGNQGWSDVTDFKKDEAAALAFAIRDAISDGALQGLRAGTRVILEKSGDLDQQISKALDFESVFTRLKNYTDPVGAALDSLDKEFSRLKNIFGEAGASAQEYADLEKLYGIERAKAIEEASERITGSLRGLYSSLTTGDNGLSLRDRRAAAIGAYQPLEDRVRAGDTTAYDKYSEAAQTLLDIERQLYGSGSSYFERLSAITGLARDTIDQHSDIARIAAERDSPFSQSAVPANDNAAVVSAIDQLGTRLLDGLGSHLDAVNLNIAALLQQGLANGTTGGPAFNFPTHF